MSRTTTNMLLKRLEYFVRNPLKRFLTHPIQTGTNVRRFRQFAARDPDTAELIREVRARKLTYLHPENLMDLAEAVSSLESEREVIQGAIIEAGAALGGSAIVLAHSKSQGRPLKVYDAFGMIPPPSVRDGVDVHRRYADIVSGRSRGIGDDVYYGYRTDLRGFVDQAFREFQFDRLRDRIELIEGPFKDTMKIDHPVALAHLDCDWYESVKTCLEAIHPHLVVGGRFVIDDYWGYSGARTAVDEFLASERAEGYRFMRKSRPHLVKLGGSVT